MTANRSSAKPVPGDRQPVRITSSSHLAASGQPELSELEFGLIVAGNAFARWLVRCMTAAGQPDLAHTDILVLHHVHHRERSKKLADICFTLNYEDTHVVSYALKKMSAMGLVSGEIGRGTFVKEIALPRGQGIDLLASAADLVKVKVNLDCIGVTEKDFDAIITGSVVTKNKPDPEIYLKAAEAIGVDPSTCIVCEDSPAGIRAAKSAGMQCVGITSTYPEDVLKSHGADYTLSHSTKLVDLLHQIEN